MKIGFEYINVQFVAKVKARRLPTAAATKGGYCGNGTRFIDIGAMARGQGFDGSGARGFNFTTFAAYVAGATQFASGFSGNDVRGHQRAGLAAGAV